MATLALCGCSLVFGIDDPVLVDGEVIPGVELSSLEIDGAAVSPAFAPLTARYDARAALVVEELAITAAVDDPNKLAIAVDGISAVSGEPTSIEIPVGQTEVVVEVTRLSTGEVSRYTVAASRTPTQTARITEESDFGDELGAVVVLDSDTLLVGAPCETEGIITRAGAVYVYQRGDDDAWSLVQRLASPTPTQDQFFGGAIAIDNDYMVIGASAGGRCDQPVGGRVGAAYVYTLTGDQWLHTADLIPGAVEADAAFGDRVDIDVDVIAVSAPLEDDSGSDRGFVYLFARSGVQWSQTDRFTGPSPDDGDRFGAALSFNSGQLAVGAPNDEVGAGVDHGVAHIFDIETGSAVHRVAAAPRPEQIANGVVTGSFGTSVSLDDLLLVVGAPSAFGTRGGIWVFTHADSSVAETAILTHADAQPADLLGLDLSQSENLIVAGVIGDDTGERESGAAILWAENDGEYQEVARIKPSSVAADARFGAATATDELRVAVGASREIEGAVYVFE